MTYSLAKMTLNELFLELAYDKTYCDVANEFYLPCMRNSTYYYRLTGFFSSGIYLIAWEALNEFIDRGGRIRIICSPHLSNDDKTALKDGLNAHYDEILSKQIISEYEQLLNSDKIIPSKILACLVAKNILEIKLAILPNDSIFHDKVGVFGDAEGNIVGFRGTMNETYKGLAEDGNSESVDVFTNFSKYEYDNKRAITSLKAFNNLWENKVPPIKVYDLPTSVKKLFLEISDNENFDELLYTQRDNSKKAKEGSDNRKLRKHQQSALDSWYNSGRRGILEHATGSGKTFTAICAIRDSLLRNEIPFILVPSTALLKQWKKELDFALQDLKPRIYLCGDNHSYWKNDLIAVTTYIPDSEINVIILAVMATASSEEFISKFIGGEHVFMVADELHRLGSSKFRNIMKIVTGPRLGLSATPQRFGDPVGTEAIYSYFGPVLSPKYTLHDAIQDGVLTEYKYYPKLVSLNIEEQDEWNQLTKKIKQRHAILKNSSQSKEYSMDNTLKNLLIKRAKILKNAQEKINAAVEVIHEYYEPGQKWIVYCDNIDEQMNSIFKILYDEEYRIFKYHSKISDEQRNAIMKQFDINGGILISVRCLDEGVDIPSVTHALIIASSKNPREFIQRRGRILRKFPGKYIAYLYDLIVLPIPSDDAEDDDSSINIIESELSRAIKFGKESPYPKSLIDLTNIAIEYNIDIDKLSNEGYDDDEEY